MSFQLELLFKLLCVSGQLRKSILYFLVIKASSSRSVNDILIMIPLRISHSVTSVLNRITESEEIVPTKYLV